MTDPLRGAPEPNRSSNEFVPALEALLATEYRLAKSPAAGSWVQLDRAQRETSISANQEAATDASATAPKTNAAVANNETPRFGAGPPCLVAGLFIRPRFGAPESPLIP